MTLTVTQFPQEPTSANVITNTLMDVDPSPTTTENLSATIPDSNPIICLPYSLVPGLDITSQSYQETVMTLGKQQVIPVPVTK